MSSENEDLRQQIAELRERVARLEARLGELGIPRTEAARPNPVRHAMPVEPPAFASVGHSGGSVESRSLESRSLESKIGSQLFNRVGIIAVLVGVAWFLKLAIDNRWIGPAGRVVAGLAAGAALIALSERFRNRGYRAFSYSLKAIATGVLYLSLWAAFALFHLIPTQVAFLAMVAVAGLNALMCWMQNSEVLAFYAAIGGFITPLLLSVRAGSELTLFTYILLLDIAVVALIVLRPWLRLLLAAFAGTTFYAVGWYASDYGEEKFGLTLFFILTFFVLFAVSPQFLRSFRLSTATAAQLIEDSLALRFLPALNAALGFVEVFLLMSNPPHIALRPWIALPFAAFYLLMLWFGRAGVSEGAPVALPSIYMVLSVVFVTLSIPMAAHGRWIAVGWFLEFVVLLWMAARQRIGSPRVIATGVLSLATLALLLPVRFFNPHVAATLILNPRFATYLVAIACCFAATDIALKATASVPAENDLNDAWKSIARVSNLAANFFLLIAVCLEIHAYWSNAGAPMGMSRSIEEQFSYSAWFMLFGAMLLTAGFWRKSAFLRWQALVLLALSIAKVFLFDTRQLSQGYRIFSFLGLGALLLTVSFAYQKDWLNLRGAGTK